MGGDFYAKLLVIVDLVALLAMRRYLGSPYIVALFALLLVIVWIQIHRMLCRGSFAPAALLAVLSAIGLYVPEPHVRTISLAVVVPSLGSAIRLLMSASC